jgi:serine/threonine-protein kinase
MRTAPVAASPQVRFGLVPPAAWPLTPSSTDRQLAISPDGTHLVYVAGTGAQTQLMVRRLDRLEPEALRGIPGVPRAPFISPDSKWVGFFQNNELRKVAITGGSSITVSRIVGTPRGASWGSDDVIVFATSDVSGLLSVPASGGEPRVLTTPDKAKGEQDHLFPTVLPGGRAVLYTVVAFGAIDNAEIAVLDVETGASTTLIRGGMHPEFVETGHIVYAAAGSLRAVGFDPERLALVGDAVPVVEQVATLPNGAAEFSLSRNGILAYVPGSFAGLGVSRSLVTVDRQGREQRLNAPARAYFSLRLSPDGARVALDIRDQDNDIWTWEIQRQTLTRLTFDRSGDTFPIWTPDGRRVVFGSARAGANNLYWQPADGSGMVERLTTSALNQFAMSFSPDGKQLVVTEQAGATGNDLSLVVLDGKNQSTPLLQTTFTEGLGELSPDGRWLAYQSNESGADEVYVRPFPAVNAGGRWQISTGGGTKPVWARNGRELFHLDAKGAMTVVPVQTAPAFSAGNPTKLFDTSYTTAVQARSYDVFPDGRRFLMIKDQPIDEQTSRATTASIVVVLNWFEELKRLVPGN